MADENGSGTEGGPSPMGVLGSKKKNYHPFADYEHSKESLDHWVDLMTEWITSEAEVDSQRV